MAEMKYTAKDSVFSYVFRQPENMRQLYLALHPEDTDVTEADCKLVTLEHIRTNGMTNDLGFQVRDIMVTLFDQERVMEIHDYNVAKEAREEGIRAMVLTLKEFAVDKTAAVQRLVKQFELLPQVAEEKVAQYWEQ